MFQKFWEFRCVLCMYFDFLVTICTSICGNLGCILILIWFYFVSELTQCYLTSSVDAILCLDDPPWQLLHRPHKIIIAPFDWGHQVMWLENLPRLWRVASRGVLLEFMWPQVNIICSVRSLLTLSSFPTPSILILSDPLTTGGRVSRHLLVCCTNPHPYYGAQSPGQWQHHLHQQVLSGTPIPLYIGSLSLWFLL